jgi:methylenetetrahydrofolate dehydrogenase (NADP+)/methenyltetrahydrofolate cyclohydrolase
MWRLSTATLRERRTSSTNKRFQHALALQLDYYMSPQFAGVASALVNGSYGSKGIDISFLPICPVGLEQANVRKHQDANPSAVAMGTVEQNIFIPTLAANPGLKTTAVAAMFAKSPLCIASLTDPKDAKLKIGTHEDTVDVMQRIFPSHEVVASPRASKNTDLLSGAGGLGISGGIGAIQAYTTTEVPALRRALGFDPFVTTLEGLNGTKLGYGQVVFAADECLHGDQRAVVQAFCEATFEGWANAIRNPEEAAEMVNEAKKMLGLDDEANDHWHPSNEFDVEMLQNCNDYVKGTFQGDRYGVINAARWNEASDWLLKGNRAGSSKDFGLDADVWQPPNNLLAGNNLARTILEDAKASATSFEQTHGRKPSLAVVTVGDLERYQHGPRRLQIYSNTSSSWFSKATTGEANGFDVEEINLDASTTTDELLSAINALDNVDGIQLMWPLPDHIDTGKVYSAIDVAKDVDGIHYVGQSEIGNKDAYPPVTPAAAMLLMEEFDVEVEGKRVLVIGRSPIVGSPIAHMVRQKGAIVTVAHSGVQEEALKKLVGDAEVVITCAGLPGVVKAEWVKGAVVVNVGTTFKDELDSLVSDVDGDIAKYASRFSPVPGGIGPLSAPVLFKNVAKAAWDQMK